jgi:hypothetical protein
VEEYIKENKNNKTKSSKSSTKKGQENSPSQQP